MADNPTQTSTQFETPGPILKAAREKAGLSALDLARELNLSVAKLAALESDHYDKLPSEVFAQGYLRRYGKLVNVDENMLVQRFQEHLSRQHAAAEQVAQAEQENAAPTGTTVPKSLLPAGVFVVAIIVLVFIYIRTAGNDAAGPVEDAQDASPRTESIAPEPQQDGELEPQQPIQGAPEYDGPDPIESADADSVAPDIDDSNTLPDAPEIVAESEATAPAEAVPLESDAAAETVAEGLSQQTQNSAEQRAQPLSAGTDTLSFAFAGDCWLEVSNAAGRIIHADLATAGDALQLSGSAPFSVMLGNARVVDLSFNGETVAIDPRPGQRTMKLTIGD